MEVLIWDLGEGGALLVRWAEIASRICDKIASAWCGALVTFLDNPGVRRSGIDNSLEGLRADFDSCDESEAFRRGMSACVDKEFRMMNESSRSGPAALCSNGLHIPLFVVLTGVFPKTPLGTGITGFFSTGVGVGNEDGEEDADVTDNCDDKESADTEGPDASEEAKDKGEESIAEELDAGDDGAIDATPELDATDDTRLEDAANAVVVLPPPPITAELELAITLTLEAAPVEELPCESFLPWPFCNPCAKCVPRPLQGFCSSTSTNSATSNVSITQNSKIKYGWMMNSRENAEVVGMLLRSGRRRLVKNGAHVKANVN